MDVGEHGEIVVRRRRQGQPLERSAVPWVAGHVAALVAGLDRIEQLHDGEDDPETDDHRARRSATFSHGFHVGSWMCCIRRVAPQKPST